MSSKTASWERSSSDSFVKKYEEQQKIKRIGELPPVEIVKNFLASITIPYIVIGGKAAVYHLSHIEGSQSSSTKKLAKSTEDYDIYCDKANSKKFIENIQLALANRGFELKETETDDENITMIGNIKKGTFESIVDIHVPKKKVDISSIKGHDGITYASVEWICNDLKNILENKSSQFEMVKYEKRKARFKLLKCRKNEKNKNIKI